MSEQEPAIAAGTPYAGIAKEILQLGMNLNGDFITEDEYKEAKARLLALYPPVSTGPRTSHGWSVASVDLSSS